MRIAVALSGGVDSTVAALLLKAKGYDLVGIFMHNWDEVNERGQCSSQEDYNTVQSICSRLNIPCKRVDLVKEYWNEIFSHFLADIQSGLTPNPDILCNQKIKFKSLLHHISHTLGVSTMATGHYARISTMKDGTVKLFRSADKHKDQTYFLSLVSQSALQHTLFPIGHMTKQEVRKLACDSGFSDVAKRKESYGLCFIGKRKFSNFLSNYIEESPGVFQSTEGKLLGHHSGHYFYTIGQRARLPGFSHPHFVVSKDPHANSVTVVKGSTHNPALYICSFLATPPYWIHKSYDLQQHQSKRCLIRINSTSPFIQANLSLSKDGFLEVITSKPFRIIAPGQFVVFYDENDGEECLGASSIIKLGPGLKSHHN